MKNQRPKHLLAALCAVLCGVGLPALYAQNAEILETSIFEDEFGSGGWLDLKVKVPIEHFATIHASSDLKTWQPATDPVLTIQDQITLQVTMASDFPQQFYRVETWPVPLSVEMVGDDYLFEVEAPITVNDALGFLIHKTKSEIFFTDVNDGGGEVKPGTYRGANLEDLVAKLGIRTWTPAFPEDDPALARLFPDAPREQTGPLPDLEPGEGRIEAGWNGDDIKELPSEGREDPEVDPNADMKLVLDLPEPPPGRLPEEITAPDPGTHLRLVLQMDVDGSLVPLQGYELPGDALKTAPFTPPEMGGTVYVVRSPIGAPNEPGQIYYIGTGGNPFAGRSYNPPFRGSHGFMEETGDVLRLAIRVPEIREIPQFEGLTVEIYRYITPADIPLLTPDAFLRHSESFERIGALEENEIKALLEGGGINPQRQAVTSTVTQLHNSGPRSRKFNFVIIADGFRNTLADQNAFNNYVENVVMDQLLSRDIHPEILGAINIFRINTFSTDSGVTQVDTNGVVTTARNTALRYRFSGAWNRCWMEPTGGAGGTEALIQQHISAHVPQADMVAVVLNEPNFGGCARSSHFTITRGGGWDVFAHEFGHNPGGLGDEYQCNNGDAGCGVYNTVQPGAPNLDNVTSRNTVKWKGWIPSWRPVPTAAANISDGDEDVGIFAGATIGSGQWWNGIYRPSWRGRMNDNTPRNNPVGYTLIRDNFRPFQEGDFRKSTVGDFNGDGRDDLVVLDDRQLTLHLAADRNVGPNDPVRGAPPRNVNGVLQPTWFSTGPLRNTAGNWLWITRKNDIIRSGDFDNDGLDDLYVANVVDWAKPYVCMLKSFGNRFEPVYIYESALPGWELTSGDKFYVADINDDGRQDLIIYNGQNWSMPYFVMLRSTGTSLQYVRRYDRYLPNWEMGRNEVFHFGDFDRDGADDFAVIDTQSWAQVHLRIYRSTGPALALRNRHYGTISTAAGGTFWQMRRKDRLHALDYDDDGTTDLAIFNGQNWGPVYLGMLRVQEGQINPQKRYDNDGSNVPGWEMRRGDRFQVADVNGDGRDDLAVFNGVNWSTQYLGILRSTGGGNLSGTWQDDWVGGWNLGDVDQFHVADFRGTGNWADLIVHNKNWLGLLRSHSNHYKLESIYHKWIHNHRYHSGGLW